MPTSVAFVSHGGGPLPLLGDASHRELTAALREVAPAMMSSAGPESARPAAVLLVSAHWIEPVATLTTSPAPPLVYDYFGFEDAAYDISYPAPGAPAVAGAVLERLRAAGVDARGDNERGLDHGAFVPLKIMWPDAGVPVVQISLVSGSRRPPCRDLLVVSGLSTPLHLGLAAAEQECSADCSARDRRWSCAARQSHAELAHAQQAPIP